MTNTNENTNTIFNQLISDYAEDNGWTVDFTEWAVIRISREDDMNEDFILNMPEYIEGIKKDFESFVKGYQFWHKGEEIFA